MVRRAVAGMFASILLAAVIGGCSGPGDSPAPDPATLRPYAERYLSLLRTKDEPALRKHLANEAHAGDAAERIVQYGGESWALADVSWTALTPTVYALSMVVAGPSGRATWRHNVEWKDDHWIMAPVGAPSGGASTTRPG
jgi:hypothetical protein